MAYVGASVVVGLAVTFAAIAASPGLVERPSWWLLATLWGGWVVADATHIEVRVREAREATTLLEVAAVPVMVLLPVTWAVLVAGTASVVAETFLTRGQLHKSVFNVSWQVTGVTAGGLLYHLAVGGFTADVPHLLAALGAGLLFVLVNLVAFAGIIAILSSRPYRVVLTEDIPASVAVLGGIVSTGVLAAVLLENAPVALPLLAVPVLLDRSRARQRRDSYSQLARERDRLDRTVAGASDGIALLDGSGRIEIWNSAMARLTGQDTSSALGRRLEELGLEELSAAGGAEQQVTVVDRTLAVHATPLDDDPSQGTVLLVRDMSLEAEITEIRDDLVSRVSHEIRTPLTTVTGFLETLDARWDALSAEHRRLLVSTAHGGAHRLSRLVSNLLAYNRLESVTRPAAARQAVDVAQTLAEIVEGTGPHGALAPVHADLDPGLTVSASAEDVRTILENLLENASRYGAPPVHVRGSRDGGFVRITVSDAGPGLPAHFRPHLFEPLAQASSGLRRTAKGVGMGLAVVRLAAATNGGTVSYEGGEGGDGGATFVVCLPATSNDEPTTTRTATAG